MNQLIIFLIVFASPWLHPFHVSVIELDYDEKGKALQLSERVFLDDLEEAINKNYKVRIDITYPANKAKRDSLIEDYILKNLRVKVDGKLKTGSYLGHEIEQDALWCYIEYYGVRKVHEIALTNTLFFDMFDDQNNLVHATYKGQTISKRLLKTVPEKVFVFDASKK